MEMQGSSQSADLPTSSPSASPSSTHVPPIYQDMRSRSMSYASGTARRQAALEAIGLRKRPDIDIVLEGKPDTIQSYSTFDEINGVVSLRFEKDTTIDDLIVTFEGQSNTYVEKVATTAPTTGRTTGKHCFLRMQQPIDGEALPENRLAKAGVPYTIPFTFVVPERLLPYTCTHQKANDGVQKLHLQLPPSLGDHLIAGEGVHVDDLSPDMAKINYCIKMKVATRSPTGSRIDINESSTRIRIVPAREEEPPLSIQDDCTDYVLRKEKGVKKGLFKIGKIGRLTAETTQPRSFRLPHVQKRSTAPIMTTATVSVRFDPLTSDEQPPQLANIVSKLRVQTFYGATPYRDLPSNSKQDAWSALHGAYPETLPLSSRNLSTVTWTRHDPNGSSPDLTRRESVLSAASQSSFPDPSRDYVPGLPFYTATILVPVTLPTSESRPRWLAPTFHSCIISRIYALEMNLFYSTPSANVFPPTIQLKVPIQISAEGGTPPPQLLESEAALTAEIERQFGLYEQRTLQDADGPASPVYEEVPAYDAPPAPTRRATVANDVAPPDYHSGLGGGRMSSRGGVPRTVTEHNFIWQRRPSALRTMRDLSVLAL